MADPGAACHRLLCCFRLWDHVSGQLLDTCHVPVPLGNVVAASTEQAATAEEAGTPEVAAEEAGALNLDSAPSSAAEVPNMTCYITSLV